MGNSVIEVGNYVIAEPLPLGNFMIADSDPSNTRRALRNARGSEGFAWVTSHVFRKTCATVLDTAGQSPRAVADQLGHAQVSMTQNIYFGRRIANPSAASALDAWHNLEDESHG